MLPQFTRIGSLESRSRREFNSDLLDFVLILILYLGHATLQMRTGRVSPASECRKHLTQSHVMALWRLLGHRWGCLFDPGDLLRPPCCNSAENRREDAGLGIGSRDLELLTCGGFPDAEISQLRAEQFLVFLLSLDERFLE